VECQHFLRLERNGHLIQQADGKFEKEKGDKNITDTAIRETEEEIGVSPKNLNKVAELAFYFPHNEPWNQLVHVYFCEEWVGEVSESEEMRPEWFEVSKLPFAQMWPDDEFWIPEVLKGNLVKAEFIFAEKDVIQNKKVQIVNNF
jgi:8-oxo-dGTP diphosphatase/2-hydroxy-dATP diphosphatase